MVKIYHSEEEQIAQLKKWWGDNGTAILTGIVLAVVVVFGWRAWQNHQQETVFEASKLYDELVANSYKLSLTDQASEEDKGVRQLFYQQVNTIKEEYSDSTYAVLAALLRAKIAVQKNDLAIAEKELNWVLQSNPDAKLETIATLRLAQVLYAKGEYEDALQLLNISQENAYAAAFEELKGDIYLSQGRQNDALSAYENAVNLGGNNSEVLSMKIDDLNGAINIQPVEESKL